MAETLEVRVKLDDQASRQLKSIDNALNGLNGRMGGLSTASVAAGSGLGNLASRAGAAKIGIAAVGVAAVATTRAILESARAYENTVNQLRLVTQGTDDYNATIQRLSTLAKQNRTSFDATVELYTKLKVATEELGMSTSDVEKLTTKLSQALAVAGADAGTANGVIRQFGQAMASGVVRGDEFNSIVEGLGPALNIMARESGITVGKLREMAGNGELTAEVFSDMLLNSNALADSFNKLAPTMDQVDTALSDSLTNLGAAIDQYFGLSDAVKAAKGSVADLADFLATGFRGANLTQSQVLENQIADLKMQREQLESVISGAGSKSPQSMSSQTLQQSAANLQIIEALERDIARARQQEVVDLEFIKAAQAEIAKLKGIQVGFDAEKVVHGIKDKSIAEETLATVKEQLAVLETQLMDIKIQEQATKALAAVEAERLEIKKREAALLAHYEPVTSLLSELEATKAAADEYGKLEKRLLQVQSAQAMLAQGFNNGILRSGAGSEATRTYTHQLGLLKEEADATRAAMAELRREQEYSENPVLRLTDRHAELKKELNEVTMQIITATAEMALAAGNTDAYEYALRKLQDRAKSIKTELNGPEDKPSGRSNIRSNEITDLADLQRVMSQESAKSATNMKIFSEYLALGTASSDQLASAMSRLGIEMDELPFEQFEKVFSSMHGSGVKATNNYTKLQQKLNGLIKDGVKLSAEQQNMLEALDQQLGNKTFNVMETLEQRMESLVGTISDSLTDVIMGAKSGFDALKDIANSVLRTIVNTLIEAQIRKMFFNTATGGMGSMSSIAGMGGGLGALGIGFGIGGLLGGMFADGGSTAIAGQKPILVGERGPEIFMPGKAGTVVANEELNSIGSNGEMNVTFNINAIDTQTGVEFIVEQEDTITGLIQRAFNRRGEVGPLG